MKFFCPFENFLIIVDIEREVERDIVLVTSVPLVWILNLEIKLNGCLASSITYDLVFS